MDGGVTGKEPALPRRAMRMRCAGPSLERWRCLVEALGDKGRLGRTWLGLASLWRWLQKQGPKSILCGGCHVGPKHGIGRAGLSAGRGGRTRARAADAMQGVHALRRPSTHPRTQCKQQRGKAIEACLLRDTRGQQASHQGWAAYPERLARERDAPRIAGKGLEHQSVDPGSGCYCGGEHTAQARARGELRSPPSRRPAQEDPAASPQPLARLVHNPHEQQRASVGERRRGQGALGDRPNEIGCGCHGERELEQVGEELGARLPGCVWREQGGMGGGLDSEVRTCVLTRDHPTRPAGAGCNPQVHRAAPPQGSRLPPTRPDLAAAKGKSQPLPHSACRPPQEHGPTTQRT